ncbi:MAG: DUF1499 domain-containing protein [Cyanobacteria bacterium J06642_2]
MSWLKSVLVFAMAVLLFGASAFSPHAAVQAASPNNRAEQQLVLNQPIDAVRPAVEKAFDMWSRGELINANVNEVTGVSRTNLFKFVDDIAVNLQPDDAEPTKTRLDIVSVGRMGEYDFGGNQRNIDEYVSTLRSLLSESAI